MVATEEEKQEAAYLAKKLLNLKYCPEYPTDAQQEFLLFFGLEAMYGGAAGGGKSSAILMAALQFIDVPGYAALILRKSLSELEQPGALLDRAQQWWSQIPGIKYSALKHQYTFPSGAKIQFGYLQKEGDKMRYAGAEFQFIAFDEVTGHQEADYRFLFSRLRRPKSVDSINPIAKVPLRMRSTSNPGGPGHDWVKARFIDEPDQHDKAAVGRRFFPAKLADNPHVDEEEYLASLAQLDIVTYQRLKDGDWGVKPPGNVANRDWFAIAEQAPPNLQKTVRYWDFAATDADQKAGSDPDWTVGCLASRTRDNRFVVHNLTKFRKGPADIESLALQQAQIDGHDVEIWIEQEPGASGKQLVSHFARNIFAGYTVHPHPKRKDKVSSATPWVALAKNQSGVIIVRGSYVNSLLDELDSFPSQGHDDQVDAVSGAYFALFGGKSGPVTIATPRSVTRTIQRTPGAGFISRRNGSRT